MSCGQNTEPSESYGMTRSDGGFSQFYEFEYPSAVRLGYLLTRSSSVCEEIAQDSFAAVYQRYDTLERPGAYLRTTLINACRRWHRTQSNYSAKQHLLHPPAVDCDATGYPLLVDVVAKLPYDQRIVIVCRYWGQWSETEIAEALGCAPGTVKSLASRAKERIKKEIGQL
jgi:RNA polymerase sigma factor (sigma-70 family)